VSDESQVKITLCIVRCVATVLCVVTLSIAAYWISRDLSAISRGYSEQVLPGTDGTHWVKPAEPRRPC